MGCVVCAEFAGLLSSVPGASSRMFWEARCSIGLLTLGNGKITTIEARNNSKREHVFVEAATINGTKHAEAEISHRAIVEGSRIVFAMTDKPAST